MPIPITNTRENVWFIHLAPWFNIPHLTVLACKILRVCLFFLFQNVILAMRQSQVLAFLVTWCAIFIPIVKSMKSCCDKGVNFTNSPETICKNNKHVSIPCDNMDISYVYVPSSSPYHLHDITHDSQGEYLDFYAVGFMVRETK